MKIQLEVAQQGARIKKVELGSDTLIGRGRECNVRILSKEVSRRHCRIMMHESAAFIRDLESANGTFVEGERIPSDQDVPLSPDDHLRIGRLDFVIRIDGAHAAAIDRNELTAADADCDFQVVETSYEAEKGSKLSSDESMTKDELIRHESERNEAPLVEEDELDATARFSLEATTPETLDPDVEEDVDESDEWFEEEADDEDMEFDTGDSDEEETEEEEWESDPETEYEWDEEEEEGEEEDELDSEELSDEWSDEEDEFLPDDEESLEDE